MDSRPSSPPPANASRAQDTLLTPERVRQIEINRLRAKARHRQREEVEASSSSSVNAHGKRPLSNNAITKSPTAPGKQRPLARDSRLGKYFDYDLSKMVNTKGGFLVEDDKEVDEAMIAKEKQRERERAKHNLEPQISLDPEMNLKCKECRSIDIDHNFKKTFGCLVCNKCKNDIPEKYSLLTKTECKEDYLLTDCMCGLYLLTAQEGSPHPTAELRDQEALPHLLKANPHKSTFANMMLYTRYQVEEFAWKKWGSPEALDAEYERRMAIKKKTKNRKFEESLRDLRRRTRETVWQKRQDAEHKHAYGPVEDGNQVCHTCGFTIEVEEF